MSFVGAPCAGNWRNAMRILIFVFAVSLLPLSAVASNHNTLTPEEAAAGWILLWDGKTEYGWEWHGDARWKVEDGVLRSDGGGYGWLGTTSRFGDFELKLEFRTAEDGNSGIFLRSARRGPPHETGYELQIFNRQPQGYKHRQPGLLRQGRTRPVRGRPVEPIRSSCRGKPLRGQAQMAAEVLDANDSSHAVGVIGLQYNVDKLIEFRNNKAQAAGVEPTLQWTGPERLAEGRSPQPGRRA